MASKPISKQIEDAITIEIAKLQRKVTNSEMQRLGNDVAKQMKSFITKGISPIEGNGRFEEYKALTGVRSSLKPNKKGIVSAGRLAKAIKETKKGYPFSVQKKFPGKKVRPVNLTLSGDFLRGLIAKVSKAGNATLIRVGYLDDTEAQAKEQGHREGVHGQPKRPTIPEGSEELAVSIQRFILDRIKAILTK